MTDPNPTPVKGHPAQRYDRVKPLVRVKKTVTDKPPLVTFDPDPWLQTSRTTPGMTNRINEERLPANPGPNQYKSFKEEMADVNVVNNVPQSLRRDYYLKIGAAGIALLVLLAFF